MGLSFTGIDDDTDDDIDENDDGDDSYSEDVMELRTSLHDGGTNRVNLAKVNASIHEVLRSRPRSNVTLGTDSRRKSGRVEVFSPSSVDSQVEAEIKEMRRIEEEKREKCEKVEQERIEQERLEQERLEQEIFKKERQDEDEDKKKQQSTSWVLYFDEENQHHYYFNTETEESIWEEEAPPDVVEAVAGKEIMEIPRLLTSSAPAHVLLPSPELAASPTKLIRNFNKSYNKHFDGLQHPT